MLPGVYSAQKKDGTIYYRASINYKNKHISLGSYTTEQEAHLTYLEAASILNNDDYSIDVLATRLHTLSFEKAVCLVNFRDNGMYIKTPIYLPVLLFQPQNHAASGTFFCVRFRNASNDSKPLRNQTLRCRRT